MLKGIVKKYDRDKGWGFIESEDGEDYFFHISNLRSGQRVENDSRVKFDSSEGQRGPEAENITIY